MLENLKCADFARHTNTKFKLIGSETVELELIEVTDKTISPAQEMFSLIFCGAKDRFLPQDIYKLSHTDLGDGELFLVPIALDADGCKYEAAFNRLADA